MIVVDSSSIISLAMNCLTPLMRIMREEFIVSPSVYEEIISRPSSSKRFAFESMRIRMLFDEGVLKMAESKSDLTDRILEKANSLYNIKGRHLKIIHRAETEIIALASELGADAMLLDERTTRLLLEDPYNLKELLSYRNKSKVRMDEGLLAELKGLLPDVPVIRSTELTAVAYERGFLKPYGGADKNVLLNALSALKFSGCSISWQEIDEYDKVVI
ncbi:MAG: hypothetical protein ABIH11_00360 [Candidatus Altiarchaeota archaeon]